MRFIIAVVLIGILSGISGTAKAQSSQQITLNEAIDLALENNYQLKQAENDLQIAETRVTSEKADFLPSLSGSSSGSRNTGRQFNNTTGEFGEFTINGFSSGLSMNLPLFTGFENINSLKSSRYSSQSQRENLERVRESIIFNAASNYLQVLLNKELLEIARENLESQRKQLEQIRAQVEVGSRPQVDLYNQESTVASQELEVTNQENALQISRIQLIRTLQIDPMGRYEFVTPEIENDQLVPREYNLENLVETALQNRSDIESQEYNIKSIKHQLESTKSQLYPTLSFSASLSSSYNDRTTEPVLDENGDPIPDPDSRSGFQTQTVSFNDQFFNQNVNRRFSLSLNIPIFSNWNRHTSIQSQKINYKNAQLSLENTRLQVVQEVNQAFTDYQAVVKRLESTEKSLQAARRSFETEQQRYEVGASTLIELQTANASYVEAQSNRAQAIYNFVFQKKLLDFYLGKLNSNISFQ